MDKQRAFADATRANERNALAVTQQAQNLVNLCTPAVKIGGSPDCATVKEGIAYAHNGVYFICIVESGKTGVFWRIDL